MFYEQLNIVLHVVFGHKLYCGAVSTSWGLVLHRRRVEVPQHGGGTAWPEDLEFASRCSPCKNEIRTINIARGDRLPGYHWKGDCNEGEVARGSGDDGGNL
jgi:hypothetical protein